VFALLTFGAVGCSNGASSAGSLEGPTWYLDAYSESGGAELSPVLPDVPVTAVFDGDTVSGSGGVNTYSALYSVDGADIVVERVSSTFMAGSDPAMRQEAAYFTALQEAASFEIADDSLIFTDLQGAALLEFRAGLESE
jgi:heat shock protein HslJ